jgi:hypothetical protein
LVAAYAQIVVTFPLTHHFTIHMLSRIFEQYAATSITIEGAIGSAKNELKFKISQHLIERLAEFSN